MDLLLQCFLMVQTAQDMNANVANTTISIEWIDKDSISYVTVACFCQTGYSMWLAETHINLYHGQPL
jgi:hypothetical protein